MWLKAQQGIKRYDAAVNTIALVLPSLTMIDPHFTRRQTEVLNWAFLQNCVAPFNFIQPALLHENQRHYRFSLRVHCAMKNI